ncbi:hypothetical protein [Ruminococcus sp.]|uniref:hypothetical protein n=1 Tax=Ruminococcus sp. TaxID=41978 RepID=UPI0025EB610B|nr:hypothetical protein [Ruminococcus sp.]MBQ8967148.1 hypothetical protein [Ruminococcus sp.]
MAEITASDAVFSKDGYSGAAVSKLIDEDEVFGIAVGEPEAVIIKDKDSNSYTADTAGAFMLPVWYYTATSKVNVGGNDYTLEKALSISAKDINAEDMTVTASPVSKEYDSELPKYTVEVKDDDKTLTEGIDYEQRITPANYYEVMEYTIVNRH